MLTLDEALAALLARAAPVAEVDQLSTLEADARVLAADQFATMDVPPMDNSQMDGYALRLQDLGMQADNGATMPQLAVRQRIAAGHPAAPLEPGTAARVFTGAFIPQGADAVVMQEQVEVGAEGIRCLHRPRRGEWIRRAGEDVARGARILAQGQRLNPQALGLAASVGVAQLPVYRQLRAGCFFTGDELAMPGEPLRPGAIYNSNRFVLVNLLRRLGCIVEDLGIVPDSRERTREALRAAAGRCDLIVSSGGMSVGEEDHVKPAVEAEGELHAWQIAIKPGKPLAWGLVRSSGREAHFIGLPGNPVSSFVTFLLFVQPFILRLQGQREVLPQAIMMRADFDWPRPDRRREFLRVRVNAQGGLERFPNQGSGVLTSTVWAEGLADIAPHTPVNRGDRVPYLPFHGWAALQGPA